MAAFLDASEAGTDVMASRDQGRLKQACQTGANGKEKYLLDAVGIEAFLYASIQQSAAHTFSRLLSSCCSNGPLWHNARMHDQHAMAGNAEAERHVLEVLPRPEL